MSVPSSYTPQLRPLSVGEVLDAGFRLLRHRFRDLLLCVLVPVLPLSILGTIILASSTEGAFDPDATAEPASGTTIAAGLVNAVLQGLVIALAVAACFKVVSAAYLGERTTVGESLRFGLGQVVPLVVASILIMLAVTLGMILLIIPGIFLAVRWAMTFPAIVFEREGPAGGPGRSWRLTKGHFWRTFGTLAIVFLLVLVVSLVLEAVLTAVLLAFGDPGEVVAASISTLVSVIATAVTYPLWAAVLTVMYYDLRVRNEGFDLRLLAEGVGADPGRFSSAPERPGEGGFAPPQAPGPA